MSLSKLFITALVALSAAYASPMEASEATEAAEAAEAMVPKVTLCTAGNFGGTCLDIPVPHSSCIDFVGGRTILNKEVSSGKIPKGIVCNFFEHFGCTGATFSSAYDTGAATWGDWPNFATQLTGIWSKQNFNDVASSMICSPI